MYPQWFKYLQIMVTIFPKAELLVVSINDIIMPLLDLIIKDFSLHVEFPSSALKVHNHLASTFPHWVI